MQINRIYNKKYIIYLSDKGNLKEKILPEKQYFLIGMEFN